MESSWSYNIKRDLEFPENHRVLRVDGTLNSGKPRGEEEGSVVKYNNLLHRHCWHWNVSLYTGWKMVHRGWQCYCGWTDWCQTWLENH